MANAVVRPDQDWACEQIARYRELRPLYEQYAAVLRNVLAQISQRLAPYAITEARAKTIASFAEKIQRKWPNCPDPLNDFTDLCGGRVITFTQTEVKSICEYIAGHFEIDQVNTVPASQRLKTSEFGYRSEHYIVQFCKGMFPNREVEVTIPEEVLGLKAEVQVRTLLEHAWAGFSHDRVYKGAFSVPAPWLRRLAGVAAMLEQADEAFSRIEQGLQVYGGSYPAYMPREDMCGEIELLRRVLACDPGNRDVAHRIAKLCMTLGDWAAAIEALEPHAAGEAGPIERDLGVCLCKLYKAAPSGAEYQRGQALLQKACEAPNPDADALASFAGTWRDIDPDKAREYYRRAYEVAPSDPYAVANFLAFEIAHERNTSPIVLMTPAITAAAQRCRDQIEARTNLPWPYFNLGIFHLAFAQPYESLAAYAKAVQLSEDGWVVETSFQTLGLLSVVRGELAGYEWARRLLVVALTGKYCRKDYLRVLQEFASRSAPTLEAPIVILAGSCDASVQEQMASYRQLLLDAFCEYAGTIISGGTTAGVGGLAGDVRDAHPRLNSVGHIPELIPLHVTVDRRYGDLRQSPGKDFDPLGPLQMWADIILSGIDPRAVKLIGIGGGKIAAAEYRIALALGAIVGVLEGSGRSAAHLLTDAEWSGAGNLVRLAADAGTIRRFLAA